MSSRSHFVKRIALSVRMSWRRTRLSVLRLVLVIVSFASVALGHFERTGYEPYCGMLHWLVDVAEKRKLQIEWLPDEAESCADCELNK